MKKPSAETQLRHCKRRLNETNAAPHIASQQVAEYSARASKAGQEVLEWKRRFDDLLRLRPGVVTAVHLSLDERVRAMLSDPSGNFIEAIKLVRNETGLPPKEAKDYVDARRIKAAA